MILRRIQSLSPLLANQIAAGEVVERPASVIKELLENSLDAGATRIEIELNKGGKQLIRVHDNGCGIHPDDMALALNRHATSKISQFNDLSQLVSLGFRGEALASIAAVSRLRLISAIDENNAQQVTVEGEQQQAQISAAAHPRGTTVEIRELFFNAPVRRRFLRTDKTEFSHCFDVIKRIALSRHEIAITFIHDGKTVLQISPAHDVEQQNQRIRRICGRYFLNNSQHVTQEAEGLMLQGRVNNIDASYAHTDLQYFYLNGRMVRDKLINHALRMAAQEFLPIGRHLAYVLYFTCDLCLVDINVHPTKHEVRFQETRLIHDFLVRALQRVWNEAEPFIGIEEVQAEYNAKVPLHEVGRFTALHSKAKPKKHLDGNLRRNDDVAAVGKPIACIKHHILVETATGLLIIDRIAAQQAIYLQQLQQGKLSSKSLLLPVIANLSASQLQGLLKQTLDWEAIGISWQLLGPQQIIIRKLPSMLAHTIIEELFKALSTAEKPLQTIAYFAAHSQANDLSMAEMENFLSEQACLPASEQQKFSQLIPLK